MLIVVIFIMVALIIGMYAMTADIKEQIQRDQEDEMIHRGVQYSRAIRRYYKKFGRYPATIEALEDTNHVRFLRKRYKDPLAKEGQWAVVRFGQVLLGGAGNAAGANFTGQTGLPNVPGVTSLFQNQQPNGQAQTQPNNQTQSTDSSGQPTDANGQPNPNDTVGGSSSSGSILGTSTTGTNNALGAIGGGAIIGVASTSPKKSLRIVADKDHYKDWKFVYDPYLDRGGLINGPYDPKKAFGQYATGMQASQGIGTPVGQQPGEQTTGSPGFNPSPQPGQGIGQPITPQQPPDQNAPQNQQF
jgi:hypothetical protein